MRVLTKKTLRTYWKKHVDVEPQLLVWYKEISSQIFKDTNDLISIYPNCRSIGKSRYIFNIKGNQYRLIVKISFELQTVWIRFIGTHQEYDTIDAHTI